MVALRSRESTQAKSRIFSAAASGPIRGGTVMARAWSKLNELHDQYDDAETGAQETAAMFAGFITRLAPKTT